MTIDTVKGASKVTSTEDNEVYRLTDMVVREVSTVDRAANKRTFLTFKSTTTGPELEPDGKGGFRVRATKASDTITTAPEAEPAPSVEPSPKPDPEIVKAEEASASPAPVAVDAVGVQKVHAAFECLEKVGRKLSRERETKLQQAVDLILSVLADAVEALDAANQKAATRSAACLKAEQKAEGLAADLASLTTNFAALNKLHTSHVRAVRTARSTVATSKVLRPEGQAQEGEAAVTWPTDLTRELDHDRE